MVSGQEAALRVSWLRRDCRAASLHRFVPFIGAIIVEWTKEHLCVHSR